MMHLIMWAGFDNPLWLSSLSQASRSHCGSKEGHEIVVEHLGFSCYLLLKYWPTLVALKYLRLKEHTGSPFCLAVSAVWVQRDPDLRGILHGYHPHRILWCPPTASHLLTSSVTSSLASTPMPVGMAPEARKSSFALKHLKEFWPGLFAKWEHSESLQGLFSQLSPPHLSYAFSLSYSLSESFRKGILSFISLPDNLFFFF